MASVGDRIDKFTLVRQLGTGGMGATWEAVRQVGSDFEQRVAIKLVEPEQLRTAEGLAGFRREAGLAASLRHPNIAAVLDVDESAGYIVCELVDGSDLRAVLQAVPGGRLDWPLVVFVLAQLARGLNHAHRRILRGRPSPVVHRDMSPGNVVVDYDGNVKIVDFGIAKALAAPAERSESLKGKLSYMAPEQAMGGRTDGRADQYALGVIAYQALCGVRPNDGANDAETLACMLEGRHVPLRERDANLPPALVKCVERMLAVHPDDRYPNLDAVLDALAELTPKLTVYRDLIPLVVAARQPHTIVRENGRFVSRPVEAAPALYAAPTPSVYSAQEAQTRRGQRMSSLAVTLGNTRQQPGTSASFSRSAAGSASTSQPEPARVQPPALPARQVVEDPGSPASQARSRLFARATVGVSVVILAAVAWVAVVNRELSLQSAATLSERVSELWQQSAGGGAVFEESTMAATRPAVQPRVLPASGEPPAAGSGLDASRADGDPAEEVPAPARDGSHSDLPRGIAAPEPAPADAPADEPRASPPQRVRVRVRVLPAGNVSVDDVAYGLAAPELELRLAVGRHIIGVSDEHGPRERRAVQVTTGDPLVVEFELAPRP